MGKARARGRGRVMRRSGWLLPSFGLFIWVMAVGYPLLAGGKALLTMPATDVAARGMGSLLTLSAGWAFTVSLGAVVIGWLPGRVLGRSLSQKRFWLMGTLLLTPICLPAYVIFYAWWQSWPADSAIHRWAMAGGPDRVRLLKDLTLYLGLLCWSWPLVSWCVAGCVSSTPRQRGEMLRIDGAPTRIRILDALRCDGPGLAIGALIVFIMTFNNTTCFDLADKYSYGNELRAIVALGANPRDTILAGSGAIGLSVFGAAAIWFLLPGRSERPALRVEKVGGALMQVSSLIWLLAVGLPLFLIGRGLLSSGGPGMREFVRLYGGDLTSTILLAAVSGLFGALVALGLALTWSHRRPWVRWCGHIQALSWIMLAVLPGTVVGVALEAAYNLPTFVTQSGEIIGQSFVVRPDQFESKVADLIYLSPAILILGHLARFGFVGALLARWMTLREPNMLKDLKQMHGAETFSSSLVAGGPRLRSAAAGAMAIVFVLSLSEIAVTAQISPPGRTQPISLAILNAMHYQRPQTVMIASLLLVACAIMIALAVVFITRGARRLNRVGLASSVIVALLFVGCDEVENGVAPALKTELMFGSAGLSPGQFNYPRAIAVDVEREFVYVVDKHARVQRFDFEGTPMKHWRMPEWEMGKPTGLSIAPDGRVFVADTHYFRIIAYDLDGNELLRFGSYGQEPGQFIYTTDIAFGPEGELFVSEYGGNDRIQVFSPEGKFLYGFGSFGSETGQFNRPQSMEFNADKTELYIADACNHRIVVVDRQGVVLRQFGGPGREAGQLAYPYDLMLLDDGTILVCEFGNNRLQRFTTEGKSLGIYGHLGFDKGELQYPWGVDGKDRDIFVVDSGNNRVQKFRSPS